MDRSEPAFKLAVVIEALSGDRSVDEVCRRHNLRLEELEQWKAEFLTHVAQMSFAAQADTSRISPLKSTIRPWFDAIEAKWQTIANRGRPDVI